MPITNIENPDFVESAKIGVSRSLSTIKQDLLLFDHIRIVGLHRILGGNMLAPGNVEVDEAVVADFDFLQNENAVSNAPPNLRELIDEIESRGLERNKDWYAWMSGNEEDISRSLSYPNDYEASRLSSKMRHPSSDRPDGDVAEPGIELIIAYADALFDGGETVALLDRNSFGGDAEAFVNALLPEDDRGNFEVFAALADIVVNRLPIPGDDVPINDILAFSRDPETRRRIRSLRLWMATAAISGKSMQVLTLEIETMVHEFSEYMNAFDRSQRSGILQLTVGIPLEVIEHIIHLEPSKLPDAILGLSQRSANRAMTELSAPGHELAYLRSANQRFGSSR